MSERRHGHGDGQAKLEAEHRERLLAEFLDSPEGERWRGDEDAEEVVRTAIAFALRRNHVGPTAVAAEYNYRDPLCWTPETLATFMTSWLARTVPRELPFFRRVPDVVPDWVRYAGRVRGVPAESLSESVQAIEDLREEMLETVNDPEAWGAAKTFALAAHTGGVDLSDPDALTAFIEQYSADARAA